MICKFDPIVATPPPDVALFLENVHELMTTEFPPEDNIPFAVTSVLILLPAPVVAPLFSNIHSKKETLEYMSDNGVQLGQMVMPTLPKKAKVSSNKHPWK